MVVVMNVEVLGCFVYDLVGRNQRGSGCFSCGCIEVLAARDRKVERG